jgi:hypothetical protein
MYQQPRSPAFEDCLFYHVMTLPGHVTSGEWDIRGHESAYLGNQNFNGKTVIDIGTASGCLTFAMERLGANVIAFDSLSQIDAIPYFDLETRFGMHKEKYHSDIISGLELMKNGFWFAYNALKSKVNVFYGDIYNCQEDFGHVDYAFFGNILLHLISPIQALNTFAPYASEKVIITEAMFKDYDYQSPEPVCFLYADISQKDNRFSWWQVTPGFLTQYLKILGFNKFDLSFHDVRWATQNSTLKHFTLVASR